MSGPIAVGVLLEVVLPSDEVLPGSHPYYVFNHDAGGVDWVIPSPVPLTVITVSEPGAPADPIVSTAGPWGVPLVAGALPQVFSITFQGATPGNNYTVAFIINGFNSTKILLDTPVTITSLLGKPGLPSPISFAAIEGFS